MNELNNIKFSKHAIKRMQQRGIKKETILFIWVEADQYIDAADGCVAQFISKSRISYLLKRKLIAPGMAGVVKDIILISDRLTIITLYHDCGRGRLLKSGKWNSRKHKSKFFKFANAYQESLHV